MIRTSHLVLGVIVVGLCAGCGGMQHERVGSEPSRRLHYRMASERPIRIKMGRVDAAPAKLAPEVGQTVARYMIDQGTAALAQHDLFEVVGNESAESDLLSQFMETRAKPATTASVEGELDIVVEQVEERAGPTVKVGFMSKQSKKAIVKVTATLRLRNGESYVARTEGTSTKGAFGVIASVRREAMHKKGGVWDIDGSGIGMAASRALNDGVTCMAKDLHREVRKLDADAIEQWLR